MLQFCLTEMLIEMDLQKQSKVVEANLARFSEWKVSGASGIRNVVKRFKCKRFAAVICPAFRHSCDEIAQLQMYSWLWKTAEFSILGYRVAGFCNVHEFDSREHRS